LEVERAKPDQMPYAARIFIAVIGLAGLAGMAVTFRGWMPEPQLRFIVYLLLALATSGMKVAFPGVRGTISLNFVLIMLGLVELTAPQTMFLAVASGAAQTFWHRRVKLVHLFFNTTCIACAVLAATWIYHKPWLENVP
jgi:hypothetical protein